MNTPKRTNRTGEPAEKAIPVTKAASGQAKAKITRKVKVITEVMKNTDIEDVENVMGELEVLWDEFSGLNQRCTEALVGADDHSKADGYRDATEQELNAFKLHMENWKASKCSTEAESLDESPEPADINLEAARQGRQREEQRLRELIAAQEEEHSMYKLRQQADKRGSELERFRMKTEMQELQSRRQQLLERQRFEEEMKALREENQALEDAHTPLSVPNLRRPDSRPIPTPMGSTPCREATYYGRPSWEPSNIDGNVQNSL